jgi:thioredoxin reductase
MTTPRVIDTGSTATATLDVAEQTDLLVVGAGPAGLAAAIAAARRGMSVVLVDENPIPAATMGDDVPLHFGQRMSGAVRNRTAMTEQMLASEPALGTAIDAGVDVRLGTVVWGLYGNGPSVGWLPGKVAGLADGDRSWMLGFKAVIVAAGRRDMGLAFPGWQRPGVMGATAAERLASRYAALDARRAVVLGTTAEALAAALALHRAGVEIAAVVEVADAPVGPPGLMSEVQAAGARLLVRHVIASADGGVDGVSAAVLVEIGADGRRIESRTTTIVCDTIVLGIGAVPVIELLDAVGGRCGFVAGRLCRRRLCRRLG